MEWKRFKRTALAVALVSAMLPQAAFAQDTSTDRFVYNDQNYNYGKGISDSPLGGSLGWGESYYLEGYMNMYEATGSKQWLDKMVDHTDRMMANAIDHDGDGYSGWPDFRYSHTQLKNDDFLLAGAREGTVNSVVYGDFETDSDADGVPDGWTQQGSASGSYRSAAPGDVFQGTAGVVVESDGTNENQLIQTISAAAGQAYEVEAFASVDTELTEARIELFNASTNQVVAYARAHHVGFERYVFAFTAPASGTLQLRLGLESYANAGYKARFDNVSVKPADYDTPLVNGAMELPEPADPTLPAGWTRWPASTVANVYVSADAHSGSRSIAVTTDNTSWEVAEQIIPYIPAKMYTLSFWGKVSGAGGMGRVEIYNATDGAVVTNTEISNTFWSQGSLTFTAPAVAGKTLKVRLYQTNWMLVGFTSWFDDLAVSASDPAAGYVGNGGFETASGADPTLPANWTRWAASTAANVYLSGDAHSGSHSLAVTTDNSSWEIAEQTIPYEPSQTYKLSFWGKVSGPEASGRVQIFNATDGVSIQTASIADTSWSPGALTFTAPAAAGKTIKIRLYQSDWTHNGFTSWFDDLALSTAVQPVERITNGTFETAASSDATLPNGWTRGAGTSSVDAYLSSVMNTYYNGAKGAAVQSSPSGDKTLEQTVKYVPGADFVLTFWGRTSNPGGPAVVDVYNATDGATLESVSIPATAWTPYALRFTAPAAVGKTLKVRVTAPASTSGAIGYVDLMSLKPLAWTDAAGWTRAGVPLSSAHRSTDASIFADGAGLELVRESAAAPKAVQELYNYKPDKTYGILFMAAASAGATGFVAVRDNTAGTTLGSWSFTNTGKLQPITGQFQTPAAGHKVTVEATVSSSGIGHKAWVDSVTTGEYWEQMVHEGIIAAPVLRFVNAVHADAALQADYLAKADSYLDFIADNLPHKWDAYWKQTSGTDGANNGTGVYIFPNGFSTEWFPGRSLPHNQYLAFARMLYLLHDATDGYAAFAADRPFYWSRANDMARSFAGTVRAHPLNDTVGTDASLWNYWDPLGPWDNGHYSVYSNEDLSHAALTMSGAMEAYRHGQVFDRADMEKFANTFTDIMWNQSLSEPVLSWQNSRQVAGTVDKTRTYQFHAWTDFAEIDPLVWDIADAICRTDPCTPWVATDLAKWSGNKTVNPGFELADPADATLPQSWTRFQSNGSTAYRTGTDAGLGGTAVRTKTNGTTWQVLEQKLDDYEPNTAYTISFLGKVYGSLQGRVQLFDYTTSSVVGQLLFNDTAWTRKTFAVTTPAAGHDIRIRLYSSAVSPANQEIGFDDVHVYPSLADNALPNAGFESADRWDASLPLYWKRGAQTAAANVTLDPAEHQAGESSVKLVSSADGTGQELIYEWKGYRPGAGYTVEANAKTSGGAGGRVRIVDAATNVTLVDLAVGGAVWTAQTAAFTAPSAFDHTVRVVVTHDNPSAAGTFWLDELAVRAD